jgi:hypothetical protein
MKQLQKAVEVVGEAQRRLQTTIDQLASQADASSDEDVDNPVYWVGPYGMRVASTFSYCPYNDGVNRQFKDGGVTELAVKAPRPTKHEYLAKFAVRRTDDNYWFKGYL